MRQIITPTPQQIEQFGNSKNVLSLSVPSSLESPLSFDLSSFDTSLKRIFYFWTKRTEEGALVQLAPYRIDKSRLPREIKERLEDISCEANGWEDFWTGHYIVGHKRDLQNLFGEWESRPKPVSAGSGNASYLKLNPVYVDRI